MQPKVMAPESAPPSTCFASAERLPAQQVREQAEKLQAQAGLLSFFDSFPDVLMILNEQRQILFVNQARHSFLQLPDRHELIGMRPGEALQCIHADESPGGCGTTEACSLCGGVRAIVNTLKGQTSVAECRINRSNASGQMESLNLRVWSTPIETLGGRVIVFCLSDSSQEYRLAALERIFFHDVLNTATGLQGYAAMLLESGLSATGRDTAELIVQLTESLAEQVRYHQGLLLAERYELPVEPAWIDSREFLRQAIAKTSGLELARRRKLVLAEDAASINLFTDPVILDRVVGNIMKNALEATLANHTVTVGCKAGATGSGATFQVHNPGEMPRDVQLQIFQRAFSTKGKGRGFGTYSIKLLTERYLQGTVTFDSSENEGTVFRLDLPVECKLT